VWRWYLYRKGVCNAAAPNVAHLALAELERGLGERFALVTQNVDGLHLRAGNSLARTMQIHGNTDYMRPLAGDRTPIPIPAAVPRLGREDPISDEVWALLVDAKGGPTRPHVLWFDECYDEALFHFESSIRAATRAGLLIVIGTSGSTNLPMQVGSIVAQRGAPMIVINRDPSPFSRFAESSASGWFAHGGAGEHLPPMVERLLGEA
ncbi:MAG: RNA polymerase subunit sigma, partial [Myxococcales bacterium]|nr:RNA polymerase subunit sigma [Myxococcales bacterium]